MKKFNCYYCFYHSFFLNSSLSAQTGVRFGLKAGYSLATQYGITFQTFLIRLILIAGMDLQVVYSAYFPITESVGIQQEFLYATKGSRQNVTITTPVNINTVSNII